MYISNMSRQQENVIPVLQRLEKNSQGHERVTETIHLKQEEFSIGRHAQASHTIMSVLVSRQHCVLKKFENEWTIVDFSKFGTLLNNQHLINGKETKIKAGDKIALDATGMFTYRFCYISPSDLFTPPAAKKIKLENARLESKANLESHINQRRSEMNSRIEAAKYEQSQIQEEEVNLKNSYQQKIDELEQKFKLERQKLESRAEDGEEQQKVLEKSRKEMEERLSAEKEEIKMKFEKERDLLQQKVEQQRLAEEKLKEENEKLLAQIETERKEFELQLAEKRRQLEESRAEARRNAEEERAEMERKLMERLELLKRQQEEEKRKFNDELEKGTLDKQKLAEEHEKIMQQLQEQETSAAQQLHEKQQLEERLQQMEEALREKEEQQQKLSEELLRKEEEKKKELEILRAQQEAENQKIREEMKNQEQVMQSTLDSEIAKLKAEKLKLEADIRVEMDAASLENKHHYETELEKIKKQLGVMESKKQVLEQELKSNNQEKEKINENCLQAKQKVLEDFGEMMQSELQCQICSELFVVAMTLNCTHTFCKLCITEWKRKQTKRVPDCPVCRSPILSENRSIVLDNFIDKMVENLTDDLKEQRKELLIERGVLKPSPSTSTAGPSNAIPSTSQQAPPQQGHVVANTPTLQTQNRPTVLLTVPPGGRVPGGARQRGGVRSGRGGAGAARRHAQGPGPRHNIPAPNAAARNQPIVHAQAVPPVAEEIEVIDERRPANRSVPHNISSDSDNPFEHDDSDADNRAVNSDSDNSDDGIIVPGLPHSHYGGYGRCYNCGMRGHWSPGCPFGSR